MMLFEHRLVLLGKGAKQSLAKHGAESGITDNESAGAADEIVGRRLGLRPRRHQRESGMYFDWRLFALTVFEELPYREVAARLSMTEANVKVKALRCRRKALELHRASAWAKARLAAARWPRRRSSSPSSAFTEATFSAAGPPAATARRIASTAPGRSPRSSRTYETRA